MGLHHLLVQRGREHPYSATFTHVSIDFQENHSKGSLRLRVSREPQTQTFLNSLVLVRPYSMSTNSITFNTILDLIMLHEKTMVQCKLFTASSCIYYIFIELSHLTDPLHHPMRSPSPVHL